VVGDGQRVQNAVAQRSRTLDIVGQGFTS
jgi:hypothetical protein